MLYREMYNGKEKPSLLGFGCMRYPTIKENDKEIIDEAEAVRMMEAAIQGGINYFDTAYPYHNGESELVLGRFMKNRNRGDYYIATKLPMWLIKNREDVSRIFEEQLNKLQMDYVDFYMLHAMDKERWELTKKLGILDMLEKYRGSGKIRYIGFSFHDSYEVFEEILSSRKWDFCQIQLNYMDTEIQAGIKGYELATKLDVPVIVMEPVKGGSLVNYSDQVVKILKDCQPEWSVASWALRWAANLSSVRVILSGMSNMEQVEDNIKTIEDFAPLTDNENKTLEEAIEVIRNHTRNGCTGCAYCVPCPAGVDIPRCFKIWNEYEMYQNKGSVHWEYVLDMEEGKRPDQCTECGACEALCPQGISIREDLKTLNGELKKVVGLS